MAFTYGSMKIKVEKHWASKVKAIYNIATQSCIAAIKLICRSAWTLLSSYQTYQKLRESVSHHFSASHKPDRTNIKGMYRAGEKRVTALSCKWTHWAFVERERQVFSISTKGNSHSKAIVTEASLSVNTQFYCQNSMESALSRVINEILGI